MMKLKPAFKAEGGTVTAGNASSLSDGASAVLLVSESAAIEKNLKPLARILAFADAECNPKDFPIAPSLAIPMALSGPACEWKMLIYSKLMKHFQL